MTTTAPSAEALLRRASLVFWDFDGVIKESVAVKTDAFVRLFSPYGSDVAERVRAHHESHGGLSRFEKIPIYLGWAGEEVTAARVEALCAEFSRLVMQAVIDSAWVPGVREYLLAHRARQRFVIVTATPQEEIEAILDVLALRSAFLEVHGAPTRKREAVAAVLRRLDCAPADALGIGDSGTDLEAALANGIPFLLRRTPLNVDIQQRYTGPSFDTLGAQP
jgi:phosphoglycolate phosphatase-like HAD superfamily hydrolase